MAKRLPRCRFCSEEIRFCLYFGVPNCFAASFPVFAPRRGLLHAPSAATTDRFGVRWSQVGRRSVTICIYRRKCFILVMGNRAAASHEPRSKHGKSETDGVSAAFSPARRRALTEPTERSETLRRSARLSRRGERRPSETKPAKSQIQGITAAPAARNNQKQSDKLHFSFYK